MMVERKRQPYEDKFLKTYYMVSNKNRVAYSITCNWFIQSIAEALMTKRGFGCGDYYFSEIKPVGVTVSNLTLAYIEKALEYQKYLEEYDDND